nr:hypothetical protein Iba_chr01cCG12900 [Ipomoea batatas]
MYRLGFPWLRTQPGTVILDCLNNHQRIVPGWIDPCQTIAQILAFYYSHLCHLQCHLACLARRTPATFRRHHHLHHNLGHPCVSGVECQSLQSCMLNIMEDHTPSWLIPARMKLIGDHKFAHNAMSLGVRKFKHLGKLIQAKRVIRGGISEKIRPQGLFLDFCPKHFKNSVFIPKQPPNIKGVNNIKGLFEISLP